MNHKHKWPGNTSIRLLKMHFVDAIFFIFCIKFHKAMLPSVSGTRFCACAQPMRDDIHTMKCRFSLAGCICKILCMRPANERRRYKVTSPLIGWAHMQNDPCTTWQRIQPGLHGLSHVFLIQHKWRSLQLGSTTPQLCPQQDCVVPTLWVLLGKWSLNMAIAQYLLHLSSHTKSIMQAK